MNHNKTFRRASIAVSVLMTAGFAAAQGPNLIQNSSFETGSLAPWTVSGSVAIASYGTGSLPSTGVAATTGGGGLLVRDGGNGAIEQIITPVSIPAGASLVVEGFLGGGSTDRTRLVVRTLDSSGTQIAQFATGFVTQQQRNLEAVHLYRRLVVPAVAAATSFAVRVEFSDQCCGGAFASADQITAHLETGSTLPPPVQIGAELLLNGGFESGWAFGSPLTLTGGGWEGNSSTRCGVVPYSNSSSSQPNGTVSCIIDGAAPNPSCVSGAAGNLLQHASGAGSLIQTIDLRGSTVLFGTGNLSLVYGAHLGGITTTQDTARVEVRFRNLNGNVLQSGLLAPVSAAERNLESVLKRREQRAVVPANTAFLDVIVSFADACCGGAFGIADNIRARLEPTQAIAPVALNTNLLANGSFENGSLPSSPLQLNNTTGWTGGNSSRTFVPQYGAPSMPSSAFSASNGLGGLLLRDGGGALLVSAVDLRGSSLLIGNGRLAMQASAWLGGVTTSNDTAEVRVRFRTIAGTPVGAVITLPPVTQAERQGVTTLIQRTSPPFAVPATAALATVEVAFTDACCGGALALADDVRLVAFDVNEQSSAVPYPGTSAPNLMLATGVDALPRTGLGETVRDATAGQVLRTQVGSPSGRLDGAPVLLALDAFVTGQSPSQQFPDIWVDPANASLIYNGWLGTFFSPIVVPLAQGGNVYAQTLPPNLSGISLLLQAVALPTATAPSPNGLYFATEAHEIRMQ